MTGNWVSFHTHTVHSTLDGMSHISKLVDRAKELGMPAIGISDHGSLSGAYEVWKSGTEAGVKPVIGMEAYLAPASRFKKEAVYWGTPDQKKDDLSLGAYTHMLLIAKNSTGLRNLYKLHELSYTEGFYYKPRIDLDILARYSDGLAATTGCAGGAVPTLLKLGQFDEAENWALHLENIFPGNLYVEVMHHGTEFDDELNAQLIMLARDHLDLPLLATNDSHYTNRGDAYTHQALLCVQTNSTLADPKFSFIGEGYWLKSFEEMSELPLPPDALSNTLALADEIESYDSMFESRDRMPKFNAAWGHSLRDEVMRKVSGGEEYVERAKYELDVIEGMGYADYFLVLADIVAWAVARGILIGPGRGSAGGSLVAYLLGVTELDPLRHSLMFERFLNPERVSPPDIDIDVQDDRRQELLNYISEKYGSECVAQISTFGIIKAKSAIKDANRVLGGEYKHGDELVKLVPPDVRGRQHPLEGLTKIQQADPEVYALATGLEGLVRNTSKHAAGVIISPEPLPENIPVRKEKDDVLLTSAFDQTTLEELGYIKYDLLGLKELSVMSIALGYINAE